MFKSQFAMFQIMFVLEGYDRVDGLWKKDEVGTPGDFKIWLRYGEGL